MLTRRLILSAKVVFLEVGVFLYCFDDVQNDWEGGGFGFKFVFVDHVPGWFVDLEGFITEVMCDVELVYWCVGDCCDLCLVS